MTSPPPIAAPSAAPPPPGLTPRDILDGIFDPLLLLEPLRDHTGKVTDFLIVEANEIAAQYYHLERDAMIGRRLLEFLPSDNATCLMAMVRDALKSGEPLVANNFAFALEIYGR
ncbi:MAG: PAS domain-containing protein [Chthoniobacterales bacterium]